MLQAAWSERQRFQADRPLIAMRQVALKELHPNLPGGQPFVTPMAAPQARFKPTGQAKPFVTTAVAPWAAVQPSEEKSNRDLIRL
jgi:hypothetical protein